MFGSGTKGDLTTVKISVTQVDKAENRRMTNKIETSSAMLISTAKADARKSVSKWRCGILGICLSFLPFINLLALGISAAFVFRLVPKIDLSVPERVSIYSHHPALYTETYRKTVKKFRFIYILCGWTVGIILTRLNLIFFSGAL